MKLLNSIYEDFKTFQLMTRQDQKNIHQLFARVFSSEDGQKTLAYLQYLTTSRVMDVEKSEAQLRHIEGQRSLIQIIQKLADRGRQ